MKHEHSVDFVYKKKYGLTICYVFMVALATLYKGTGVIENFLLIYVDSC